MPQPLPFEGAADVIEDVPEAQAADTFEHLSSEDAAVDVSEMISDERVDTLAALDDETAGGITEFLAYNQSLLVKDVQYTYVVDDGGKLTGVLRLRDVVLSPGHRSLVQAMMPEPQSVTVGATLGDLHDFFETHHYVGVPVVDSADTLVGVVLRSSANRAESKHAKETYLESTGIVGGEELRSMGFFRRSSRRLSWLSVNILLNLLAASVIAAYQDVLTSVIVLAVFLPIISDMSGCSGNQAVAVSIRELSLGLVRPRDLFRVLWKEGVIGILNGVVLGVLLGGAAFVWQGNPYLGGVVPLALRGMGQDPALASGPILTTVTDMCGFFLVLSFAASVLPLLVP